MKIQALLDGFDDKDWTELYAKENFKMSFLIRFLALVMPGILTFFTLMIYAKTQGLSEEVFYDLRVFISIATMLSAEVMIFVMLIRNLKPENPGETLFTFKKMFLPITEVVLMFIMCNGFQSLVNDIIARDKERQTPVTNLTMLTYFAYILTTVVVLKAFLYCRNTQSTSDLGSENGITNQEICNPD